MAGEMFHVNDYRAPLTDQHLDPNFWMPYFAKPEGHMQYRQLVNYMVKRMHARESNPNEIKYFANLVGYENDPRFLILAEMELRFLNEWGDERPSDPSNHQICLFWYLFGSTVNLCERRSLKKLDAVNPTTFEFTCGIKDNIMDRPNAPLSVSAGGYDYSNGLSEDDIEVLRTTMFGPRETRHITPAMDRMFKSSLELSYPQAALSKAVADAKRCGRDIERDQLGLPMNLMLPITGTTAKRSTSSQVAQENNPMFRHEPKDHQDSETGPVKEFDDDLGFNEQSSDEDDCQRDLPPPTEIVPPAAELEELAPRLPMSQVRPSKPSMTGWRAMPLSPRSPISSQEEDVPIKDAPVYPPGLVPPLTVNTLDAFVDLLEPLSSSAIERTLAHTSEEPHPDPPPLKTAYEIDTFARIRARNTSLLQLPSPPRKWEWDRTRGEDPCIKEMKRRSKEILAEKEREKQKQIELERKKEAALAELRKRKMVRKIDWNVSDEEWMARVRFM